MKQLHFIFEQAEEQRILELLGFKITYIDYFCLECDVTPAYLQVLHSGAYICTFVHALLYIGMNMHRSVHMYIFICTRHLRTTVYIVFFIQFVYIYIRSIISLSHYI